jgi:hypothetical protein
VGWQGLKVDLKFYSSLSSNPLSTANSTYKSREVNNPVKNLLFIMIYGLEIYGKFT